MSQPVGDLVIDLSLDAVRFDEQMSRVRRHFSGLDTDARKTATVVEQGLSRQALAAQKAGISVGQYKAAMRTLPAQFTDIATQLLTRSSTLTCRLPLDSACSARRFRRARCSIRCSADSSESVTDTPLYSNCSVFRNMYYLRLPCSARFSNGDFSYRGKLTITGNHGDTHFSSLNPRHSDRHIFHSNGSR